MTPDVLAPFANADGFLPHLPGLPEAINADSFDEDVLESPVPVLVEFWTARCASCRRLAPLLQSVAGENNVRVFTVDVDAELPAAVRFGVQSVPQVLLFAGGTVRGRLVGVPDRAAITAFLRENRPEPKE